MPTPSEPAPPYGLAGSTRDPRTLPQSSYGDPGFAGGAPGYGAAPSGFGAADTPSGPPLGRLLRRRWLLLALGIAAGLGLGYYHFTQQDPTYVSFAEVTVSYRQASLPVETDGAGRYPMSANSVIGNYLHRIKTPPLIARAVKEHGLMDLSRFRGGGSPVNTILRGLDGRQIEDTQVLRLSYNGKSPEETKAVLDAVVDTFIDSVRKDEQSVSEEAIDLITKATKQVRDDLEDATARYRAFLETSPLTRGEDGTPLNPYAADLRQIDARRDEYRLELTSLAAEVKAIRAALAAGGRREALVQMASLSRRAESAGELPPEAVELNFEEKNLDLLLALQDAKDRFGENHPDRKRLEKRYEALRGMLAERAGLTGGDGEPKSFLDLFVDAREERLEVLRTQIESLDREYVRTEAEADKLRGAELTDQELRDEVRRHGSMHEALVDKIAQLDLTKDASRVRVSELVPAGPGSQTPVELVRSLAVGGVMGLAIAFGLAYLLEQGDRSFKGPEELRAEFGLPLLGHIPAIPQKALRRTKQTGVYDPSLLTVHRAKSRLAESFRAVRAGLMSAARSGVKVIQVTSGDPGDGKSTLAGNLAVSLGRSGKSTILVDVDLRRPRVAKLFGLTNEGVCVTDVINDPDRLDEAVLDSGVDGLSLLPCLRRPDHPAETLSSQAFEEFVEVLRQKFDFVILDSPPVLAVSDPAAVAPIVDGVILVTRLSKRTRRKVRESLDMLDRAGANVLGLVINAITPGGEYLREVESGYSGGYGYGYGYRYGYGNGSKRGDYYTEERSSPARPVARAHADSPADETSVGGPTISA